MFVTLTLAPSKLLAGLSDKPPISAMIPRGIPSRTSTNKSCKTLSLLLSW